MTAFQHRFRLHTLANTRQRTQIGHGTHAFTYFLQGEKRVGWLLYWDTQFCWFVCITWLCVCMSECMHVCCLIVSLPTYSSHTVSAAKAMEGALTFCKQKNKQNNTTLPLSATCAYIQTYTHCLFHILSYTSQANTWPMFYPTKIDCERGSEKRGRRCVADQKSDNEKCEVNNMEL